jgi:hypothetical protein
MSGYSLIEKIIERSRSNTWREARREWSLQQIYKARIPGACLCGHFPIIEMYLLRNMHTGETVAVGNHCIHLFLGLPSDTYSDSVKRVFQDRERSFNEQMIHFAEDQGWINKWEYGFYISLRQKRKLSANQLKKKLEINGKILQRLMKTCP